jgi:hypothetical protein
MLSLNSNPSFVIERDQWGIHGAAHSARSADRRLTSKAYVRRIKTGTPGQERNELALHAMCAWQW